MSQTPTPDRRGDQIAETFTVHNLMRTLPQNAQDKLRQIALRERKSILQVTREAILSYTHPQPAAW